MKAEDLRLLRADPSANLYLAERAKSGPIQAEFDALAGYLHNRFRPRRALELGCANGLLVASLRKRGVEAEGVDRSCEALEGASVEAQPFLRCAPYHAPFAETYDLVVCLQALVGLDLPEAEQVIENICRCAPVVFFCQAALDPGGERQPGPLAQEDWARLFARADFYHELESELEEFSPWCRSFRRVEKTKVQLIEDYERRVASLRQELRLRRSHGVETHLALTRQEAEFAAALAEIQERSELALSAARQHSESLQHELDEVYASRVWRLTSTLRRIRLFFIPHGSRRERWLLTILGK